ncbi:hypothetical protein SNE40_002806 [Patella caerulea]|uniref:PiggyBac transposable element-derived protein domain-containing protein n=1 Tax=Patella caerulea TaxID=87958 RepID=A0AAN8PZN0_PATCE
MEYAVIKPRCEQYWTNCGKNFISHTPGFREVMDRDRFLGLLKFLHLVDEHAADLDKSDKIYKMRPFLDTIFPKFRNYFTPQQNISVDEGMIPTKGRLGIKQYIKDKPTNWGIKAFMLTDSESGYILSGEIYTAKCNGLSLEELGATGSLLLQDAEMTDETHIVYVERFYSSVKLFYYLYDEMRVHAVGTVMTNRKHYPKQLKKKNKDLKNRGDCDCEFLCRHYLSELVWQDRKPINFLST